MLYVVPHAALAQDASSEEPICVLYNDPDDPSVAHADWTWTLDGELLPELQISAVEALGVLYRVELRTRFGADELVWTLGPWSADDTDTLIVPVVVPDEAYVDPDQGLYLTDLHVQVVVLDAAENPLQTVAAPSLRLVWPDDALDPVLMDVDTADVLAPSGVFGDEDRLAALREHEDDLDGNVEYGPAP